MATLKICTVDKTHWIPEVESLLLARSFSIPEGVENPPEPSDEYGRHELTVAHDKAIIEASGRQDRPVHLANFRHSGTTVGNVLYVDQRGKESQAWIVPDRACFLMADNGKTIDRI